MPKRLHALPTDERVLGWRAFELIGGPAAQITRGSEQ